MHNAAFAALHIDASYALWPTTLAALPARVASLRDPAIWGANVTIPHKRAVLSLIDAITPAAAQIGAVNTIINRSGILTGDNTDADGLAAALREVGRDHIHAAVILGAGGAARGAIIALAQLGARDIHIAARRAEMAAALANEMAEAVTDSRLTGGALAEGASDLALALGQADVVVNATPLGMAQTPGLPLSTAQVAEIAAAALVLDLITAPTPLLTAAQARGLATMNGLPMLLHQGALAFTRWTGLEAPLAVMRAALDA